MTQMEEQQIKHQNCIIRYDPDAINQIWRQKWEEQKKESDQIAQTITRLGILNIDFNFPDFELDNLKKSESSSNSSDHPLSLSPSLSLSLSLSLFHRSLSRSCTPSAYILHRLGFGWVNRSIVFSFKKKNKFCPVPARPWPLTSC